MAQANELAERMVPGAAKFIGDATISVTDIAAMLLKMAENSDLFVDGRMKEYLHGHGELATIAVRNEDVSEFLKKCGEENISCLNLHLSKDGMRNMTIYAVKKGDLERALQISRDVHGLESLRLTPKEAGEKWAGKAVAKIDHLSYKEARILQEELASAGRESLMTAIQTEDALQNDRPASYYVITPKEGIGKGHGMDDLDRAVLSMELKMVTDYGLSARRHMENEWNTEEAFSRLMSGDIGNHVFYDAANPKNSIEIQKLDDGNIYAEIIQSVRGEERVADALTLNPDNEKQRLEFEQRIKNTLKGYVAPTQMTAEDYEKNKNRPKVFYRANSDIEKMHHIDNELARNYDEINNLIQLKLGFNTEDHAVNIVNGNINLNTFESEEIKNDLKDIIQDGKESSIITRVESNLAKLTCTTGIAEKYIVMNIEDQEQEVPEEVQEQLTEELDQAIGNKSREADRSTGIQTREVPNQEDFETFGIDDVPDDLDDVL